MKSLALGALLVLACSSLTAEAAPAPALSDIAAFTPVRPVAPDYRLGPGDKLRVAVFGVDTLGGDFEVPGGGVITLPLIGATQAAGLTTLQLQSRIEASLRDGYVKDPHVSVQVMNYRPFFILGEVNKPGEYAYTDRLTVMSAVAEAGGFTYRARTKIFRRHRIGIKGEPIETLTADSVVQPGDTIRIQERSF